MIHQKNEPDIIIADELGLSTIVSGPYRLKTTYQPIFRRSSAGRARIFALSASAVAYREGSPVLPGVVFSALSPERRMDLQRMVVALGLRNLAHVEASHLPLLADARFLPDLQAHAGGGHEKPVIASIPANALLDRQELIEQALALRADGLGLALTNFGGGPWDVACLQAMRPDIVHIDPEWYSRVAREPSAVMLLKTLVSAVHEHGIEILIDGISTAQECDAAIECDADLFRGDLLAEHMLAGSVILPSEVALGDGALHTAKVVSFTR